MKARALTILTVMVMTACTKPAPAPEEGEGTQPVAEQPAAADTGAHATMHTPADSSAAPSTASMDHGNMAARPGGAAATPAMPGMDHSRMPMPAARGTGNMAGMDHTRIPTRPTAARPSANDMSAMDHAQMARQNTPAQLPPPSNAARQTMPGMDHAAMGRVATGSTTSEDAAFEKLRLLVAELMRDPAIQARIQNDTVLRRLWSNEQVRQAFIRPN
ncbi:MAG: hypothetical protein WEE89_16690 [Gemmatimonadota bacterium]